MSEAETFKDWFSEAAALELAEQVARAHPKLDVASFVADATEGLASLEMMGRVRLFCGALRKHLPQPIDRAFAKLQKSLPPVLPSCDGITDRYLQWPVGEFIALFGPHGREGGAPITHSLDAAFELMVALTQCFSSEFAVRPLMAVRQDEVLARLMDLVEHESPHVRRWCSEGTRPRLPWGERLDQLVADPTPTLPILEALKDDPEEYVRRSVANHLNDIAKDHPELVVEIAERWWEGASVARQRLVKHALRSLIKAGHVGALGVLGYRNVPGLKGTLKAAPKKVRIGESLELTATLSTPKTSEAMVDFVVHYVKANGQLSPKVFKWATRQLPAGQSTSLSKSLAMVERSTRRLYPGLHRVELQVNGSRVAAAEFTLVGAQ